MITVRKASLPRFAQDEFDFTQVDGYKLVQSFIVALLKSAQVQAVAEAIMNIENITADTVREIRVMALPTLESRELKVWENHLLSRYWPVKRRIDIFPPLIWQDKKEPVKGAPDLQPVVKPVVQALIRELLHIKYKEEAKIRKLVLGYFKIFPRDFRRVMMRRF